MSRTYRRLKGNMRHRGSYRECSEMFEYTKEDGYPSFFWLGSPAPDKLTREMVLNRVRFHMDGRRTMGQIPSWHWHEVTTVPARREERDLCKKILRLKDLEDAPLFPTRKRPKEWFW